MDPIAWNFAVIGYGPTHTQPPLRINVPAGDGSRGRAPGQRGKCEAPQAESS